MVRNNLQAALHQLEYSQLWLDYGILIEAQLQEQLAALATGEDDHTEHYRYQTLNSYITGLQRMSNEELHKLLEVIVNDQNFAMSSSAVILLLKQSYLTDEQFEIVTTYLDRFGEWTQKEVVRQRERRSNAIPKRQRV